MAPAVAQCLEAGYRIAGVVVSILEYLQKQNYITFSLLENKKVVKFQITDWPKDNTVLEYNFPCKKDDGFFFFPISKVHELISMGKCSEMDMLLDMWIHAIYNDPSVQGSYSGPVVYYLPDAGTGTGTMCAVLPRCRSIPQARQGKS